MDFIKDEQVCNRLDSEHQLEKSNDDMNCDDANAYTIRTHTCGELRISDIGKEVKLCGWVEFLRLDKFILLRDAYGTTQIITKDSVRTIRTHINSQNSPIDLKILKYYRMKKLWAQRIYI